MEVLIITDAILRGEALGGLLAKIDGLSAQTCTYAEWGSGNEDYDVVVCDAADADQTAIEMIAALARECPSRPIVAVSSAGDDHAHEFFQSGAAGVVRWDSNDEELRSSIHEVIAGKHYATSDVLRGLISAVNAAPSPAIRAPKITEGLTAKERAVVDLLLQGMANQEIAQNLLIAETTVKAHLARIMKKWGVRDRLQLVLTSLGRDHKDS